MRGPGPSIFPSLNLVEIQLRRVEIQEMAHPTPGTPGCVTFSPGASPLQRGNLVCLGWKGLSQSCLLLPRLVSHRYLFLPVRNSSEPYSQLDTSYRERREGDTGV